MAARAGGRRWRPHWRATSVPVALRRSSRLASGRRAGVAAAAVEAQGWSPHEVRFVPGARLGSGRNACCGAWSGSAQRRVRSLVPTLPAGWPQRLVSSGVRSSPRRWRAQHATREPCVFPGLGATCRWGGTPAPMLRLAGTTAGGRGPVGALATAGAAVRLALRAGSAAAGAAWGSAWACVSAPEWAAAAAWEAVPFVSRALQRRLRYPWASWVERVRSCRRGSPWQLGGCGALHRILGSGEVPCQFGLRGRSRRSMGLPCTGLVGRSLAWRRGRS